MPLKECSGSCIIKPVKNGRCFRRSRVQIPHGAATVKSDRRVCQVLYVPRAMDAVRTESATVCVFRAFGKRISYAV